MLQALSLFLLAKDFVPTCDGCKEHLRPYGGDKKCPLCKGREGAENCFQFDCDCGHFQDGNRPAYCGSHPFFGGYRLPDQLAGRPGPGLWEEEIEVCQDFTVSGLATGFNRSVLVGGGQDSGQECDVVISQ